MNALSLFFLSILSLVAATSCPAQDDPGILNLLMTRSDAVVAVTSVKSDIGPRFSTWCVSEHFKDVVTLAGKPVPDTLTVEFSRLVAKDLTPLKPGQRLILFLKLHHAPTMDVWEPTDFLFGCHLYTEDLKFFVSEAAKPR